MERLILGGSELVVYVKEIRDEKKGLEASPVSGDRNPGIDSGAACASLGFPENLDIVFPALRGRHDQKLTGSLLVQDVRDVLERRTERTSSS
jgi:hypothetical protein